MAKHATDTSNKIALDPRRPTQIVLILFLLGFCSRGYRLWDQLLRVSVDYWVNLAKGLGAYGSAPAQYRIGVISLAYWITQHSPLRLSRAFTLLELIGSLTAALVLYGILQSRTIYRNSTLIMRWFASASFVALFLYYVDWTYWYQKPETLPIAGIMALLLALWTSRGPEPQTPLRSALTAAAIILLCALQSFVRADSALVASAGIFLVALTPLGTTLSLPRGLALVTVTIAGIVVIAIQVYLIKVRFRAATYGDVPVFMFLKDYYRIDLWATCLIFMAPFLWTLYQLLRKRPHVDSAGIAFVVAGTFYFALWVAVGRLDENRIFIPMALCSIPTTVSVIINLIQPGAGPAVP